MTDSDDERRELAHHLLDGLDNTPADIVDRAVDDDSPERRAMLRRHYLDADARVGTAASGWVPGELRDDVDGLPGSVGPTRSVRTMIGSPVRSAREIARVGLTPADLPNTKIIDTKDTP